MNSWIDLKGASGATYRYMLAEGAKPRTAVSGTFVYIKDGKEPKVLYAGQAINLSEGASELWQQAQAKGATHIYTRLNVAAAAREAELADLLAAETPPMNEQH